MVSTNREYITLPPSGQLPSGSLVGGRIFRFTYLELTMRYSLSFFSLSPLAANGVSCAS